MPVFIFLSFHWLHLLRSKMEFNYQKLYHNCVHCSKGRHWERCYMPSA